MKGSQNSSLASHLAQAIDGTVYSDHRTLLRYSTDKSIYQVLPKIVTCPASIEDLSTIVTIARQENMPITARGGGSGTAGAALGEGIIIHFPKSGFLNNIIDFRTEGSTGYITVEAGVYHDTLQHFLKKEGYYLPADPSSGPLCQIGGNIATKASGPHGFSHGSIDRFLEDVQYISAQGQQIDLAKEESIPTALKTGIIELKQHIDKDKQAISRLQQRHRLKTASGYNLFTFIHQRSAAKHLTQLFAGSVGTLGIITQATLRVEPYVPKKSAVLLYFRKVHDLGRATQEAIAAQVTAIELISQATIRLLKKRNGPGSDKLDDGHLLFIECEGASRHQKIAQLQDRLKEQSIPLMIPAQEARTQGELAKLWKLRKQILPILLRPGTGLRALSIVNDVGVPPQHLPDFIQDIEDFFAGQNLETVIFGHAGNGNLHLRPLINIEAAGLKERLQSIADGVYEIVFRYNGTITAEHGMGRLRTPYLEREWGALIYSYMKGVKEIFDPDNIFNPEAMFGQGAITDNLCQDILGTDL